MIERTGAVTVDSALAVAMSDELAPSLPRRRSETKTSFLVALL